MGLITAVKCGRGVVSMWRYGVISGGEGVVKLFETDGRIVISMNITSGRSALIFISTV